MAGLTLTERSRLLGCLNLLSRAGTPGERDAAIAAANRMLESRGLTWGDLIPISLAPPQHEFDWYRDLHRCLDEFAQLTPWEQQFIQGIMYRSSLSEKQRAALARIILRLTG